MKLVEGIDAAAFAGVESAAFRDPWTSADFGSQPHRLGLALFDGDRCISYVYGQCLLDEAEIFRIGTHPEQRRRGLAARILAAFVDRVRSQGASCVLLEVSSENRGAVAFYERTGFREVGRRRDYYASGEDALLMRRDI
ncbi:ribosomal protein S18-alanine N-acetyltransferase [Sulfidibacter corallicola]|uniref:[Ribosomal protein bS18]-alanine N-acetyltransferase n=1 Tax=Sulfidibacter corallicola TaxID=2818388 RepID=A0A8A4TXI2_SULCO|nr:ribosomal protein S18-alanine N-acetyltransferase [Sulfidibacter corallicola]QTD53908.1 ribosomal protein S18-alanine N-acetyltransferase [Sulfidibacter corallicola]